MLETTKQLLEVLEQKEINHKTDSEGVVLDSKQQERRIAEILALSNTHNFKGHVKMFNITNVTFEEKSYIQHERRTNELFTSSFKISMDECEKITFFISNSEWYDMVFDFKDGLGYAILTCVPK